MLNSEHIPECISINKNCRMLNMDLISVPIFAISAFLTQHKSCSVDFSITICCNMSRALQCSIYRATMYHIPTQMQWSRNINFILNFQGLPVSSKEKKTPRFYHPKNSKFHIDISLHALHLYNLLT